MGRELLAEFAGTLVLIMFGAGVVAQTVLFPDKGSFTNINIGWGLGVMFGIYVAGRVSGAHLNPAVTIALAAIGAVPWRKVIPYSLAQTLGAFFAAALVFLVYRPAFLKVDPALEKTAGIFTTFPAFPENLTVGFADQFVGTALLLFLVMALGDARNQPLNGLGPMLVGLIVVAIGMSFGSLHGYAINPARDLGPRLLTVIAGFQNNGLTSGPPGFWVPIVAPILGGLAGAFAYTKLLK